MKRAILLTNAPPHGDLYNFFLINKSGQKWLRRNRILTTFNISMRAAIELSKEEGAAWIAKYWAIDTRQTSDEAIKQIKKRVFKVDTTYGLFIGASSYYMEFVLTMAERMRKKGKSVNWTNKNTKIIEDDIIGNTVKYVNDRLKININMALSGVGLGWMLGKGRMPKKMVVMAKRVKRYQGKVKPIRWVN